MATLKPGETLSTREPVVDLDPSMPVGLYRVQLTVEGPSGVSAPAEVVLRVIRLFEPDPVPIGPRPLEPVPLEPTPVIVRPPIL